MEIIRQVFFIVSGRVLSVESQEMKFHDWGVGVDPDESCWVESVKYNLSFLVVIRIFYEIGQHAFEEIGKFSSSNLLLSNNIFLSLSL